MSDSDLFSRAQQALADVDAKADVRDAAATALGNASKELDAAKAVLADLQGQLNAVFGLAATDSRVRQST